MSEVRNGDQKVQKCLFSEIFYGQIFLEISLTRQCLERRIPIFLSTPDCVLFQEKLERA